MLKALRNFLIGLIFGAVVFFLALPYVFFDTPPWIYYADALNDHLRTTQDTRQLARYFDDSGQHLPILTYRYFVEADEEGNPVGGEGMTLEQFERQMETLHDIGCTFIDSATLLDCIDNNKALPERAVLITFDDCSSDIYTKAFPILKKYNIHATVNVIGYYMEHRSNYHTPLLTPEQLFEMRDSGLIDLQSETFYSYVTMLNEDGTFTYPFSQQKQNENWDQYYNRLTKDLLRNNIKIMTIQGEAPVALAYPYGASNATTSQAMESVGLRLGFDTASNTCMRFAYGVDPYHLPRYEMNTNFKYMKDFLLFINS